MAKRVVENEDIVQMGQELLGQIHLFADEDKNLSLRHMDPFAKVFLQLKYEYRENKNTFTAHPNKTFLAFIVLEVLHSDRSPSEELLSQLTRFVSPSPLSDFAFFNKEDMEAEEAKRSFLRQQIFPEMLEDFDHEVNAYRIEEVEKDPGRDIAPDAVQKKGEVTKMVPPLELPDDMLEEDLPELRQGLVKVKKA